MEDLDLHLTQSVSMETHPPSPDIPSDKFENHTEDGFEFTVERVINHLDCFERKLVDSGLQLERTKAIDKRIEDVLSRQLQDGLLTYVEYLNLNHIKALWTSSLNILTTSYLDRNPSRKRVIANLIDLYTLNEIGREQLLDIIYKL